MRIELNKKKLLGFRIAGEVSGKIGAKIGSKVFPDAARAKVCKEKL